MCVCVYVYNNNMIQQSFLMIIGQSYNFHISRFLHKKNSLSYCLDLLRKRDYENYLCTILLPKEIRRTAIAIRAFNIEVAILQDQISDLKIGKMRFKFWENSLAEIYENKVPKHPVLIELHSAVKNKKLNKLFLKRLILARENFMLKSSFETMEDLEKYAEDSVSPIYYLLLEAMGLKNVNADHAVSHLGKCHGIVNMIRSLPYSKKWGHISLPQEILLKYNVSQEKIIRQSCDKNICDSIFEVASRANSHLVKATAIRNNLDTKIKSIFLSAVPLNSYLEKLQRSNFNVFDEKLQKRDNLLPIKLLWNKLMN
ncbi:NADH dehydrogenase (ubiquinone) complex I, assembly factor 6 [Daktulosphaira vitifoliae]|uniref:NADH dehydrogenase (ubiquinone) complex I, assembly factor 6 n=1 Tax=Daktulosphaira vitifoliae TaxID=58002 RepID=UPI0021AA92D0|nr:NADH dehydrogenase (ubiquinone) complex I, assembly factor 6 [Daktulosphaira vitifoliae]XP_050527477.1 NADH dehydrogenase (ubiquinone) complex I, assembly factor 6 [Daktulosphaira vitifoliae]